MSEQDPEKVPVSVAALRLRLNREQLIRRIQQGEIVGGQEGGRWFVAAPELERLAAKAPSAPNR